MAHVTKFKKRQESSKIVRYWVEWISIILMSVATIATAWSSYQAAGWGGVMTTNFNQANIDRSEAMRYSIEAGQKTVFDAVLFNEWLKAVNQEDEALIDFYFERMGDLRPALEAWIATAPIENPNAPLSPFVMDEYVVEEIELSQNFEIQASEFFSQGMNASQQSDRYVFNAVILASVLFFSGISTRFKQDASQILMLLIGFVFLTIGIFNILSSPIF